MGIAIDILVVLFLAWSLYRGWKHGFLYQLGQMALAVVAYFAARGLGTLLADPITGAGVHPNLAATIGFFSVFLIIFVVGGLFLRKLTKDLLSFSDGLSTVNRVLGIVLGAAKGALLAYLIMVGLIMAHRMTGKVPIPFESSVAGRLVLQNNFLDSDDFPRAKAMTRFALYLSTHNETEVASNPHIQAILSHPKASSVLTAENLTAFAERDYVTLFASEEVWDFLDEPDIQEHLNALEVEGMDLEAEATP
ncbi:MAG: putative membrane protein required for colicin V production [Myxococcota bacterium]|jgi:uncharacterized membrane protein required for colicin V production